jgi:hypothetical protein
MFFPSCCVLVNYRILGQLNQKIYNKQWLAENYRGYAMILPATGLISRRLSQLKELFCYNGRLFRRCPSEMVGPVDRLNSERTNISVANGISRNRF